MNRNEYLRCGDLRIEDARLGARLHCDESTGRFVSGFAYLRYLDFLKHAAWLFRQADVSMLAGRVEWLSRQEHVPAAWEKFDRLNTDRWILCNGTTRSTT